MLGVAFETRIVDLFDGRMVFQKACDLHGIAAVTFHPDRQGFQRTQNHKTVEGTEHRSNRVLQEFQLFFQFLSSRSNHSYSANHIGVPVEVFGRTVHGDVETMVDGSLNPGGTKGVVADGNQSMPFGDPGNFSQIHQFQQGIRGTFHPDHPCVFPDFRFQKSGVGKIDEGTFQPGSPFPDFLKKPVTSSIKIVNGDDMISTVQEFQQGSHTGQA